MTSGTPVENAASAKINGVEGDFTLRPVDGLDLSASMAYVDSEYRNFSTINPANTAAGTFAPPRTAGVRIGYSF